MLVADGQPSSSLFFVTAGRLGVRVTAAAGVIDVATIAPGGVVAEISFIDGGLSSATVSGTVSGALLALDRDALVALTQTHPAVAAKLPGNMCATLAARIRTSTDCFDHLRPRRGRQKRRPGLLDRLYALFGHSGT